MQKKVMLEEDYEDGTTMWRVACDCHDPEHDLKLWFEVDDIGVGSLMLETEIGWFPRYHDTWFKRVKRRVVAAGNILFKGHYTMRGEVVLQRDGILGLQHALKTGLAKMDKASKDK